MLPSVLTPPFNAEAVDYKEDTFTRKLYVNICEALEFDCSLAAGKTKAGPIRSFRLFDKGTVFLTGMFPQQKNPRWMSNFAVDLERAKRGQTSFSVRLEAADKRDEFGRCSIEIDATAGEKAIGQWREEVAKLRNGKGIARRLRVKYIVVPFVKEDKSVTAVEEKLQSSLGPR